MNTNNRNQKNLKSKLSFLVIGLLLISVIIVGYSLISKNVFDINSSEAESKNYSKTYPAGDIVETSNKVKVLNYTDAAPENNNEDPDDTSIPVVAWKSVGKKIKISTKKGKPSINGWRSRSSPYLPRMTYISKSFVIPKPVNTRNRPMAVQLCWKARSYDSVVNMTLYREKSKIWHHNYSAVYDHRNESNETARRLGCYGFSRYIFDTENYGSPVNRQVNARLYISVMGEPIDIAAIKVQSIQLPTGDQTRMRSDFNNGKLFGDEQVIVK